MCLCVHCDFPWILFSYTCSIKRDLSKWLKPALTRRTPVLWFLMLNVPILFGGFNINKLIETVIWDSKAYVNYLFKIECQRCQNYSPSVIGGELSVSSSVARGHGLLAMSREKGIFWDSHRKMSDIYLHGLDPWVSKVSFPSVPPMK